MPAFFNAEWLNSNSQRSYPFAEHATKTDVTSSIVMPDSFLVELYMPVAAVFDTLPDKFYIQSIAIIGAGYVLNIGYDDGTSNPATIAVTSIARTNFHENGRYALVGTGDFDDTVGKVVIGRLQEIERLPAGIYTFTPAGGAIDPDCIRPMIRGVSSIAVDHNGVRGPRLRDRVILSAGNGIRLSTITGPGIDSVIRIDAIPGSLEEACLCDEPQPPCIRTINGIPGDSNQNFTLTGDNCLVITPAGNGLRLEDKCCKPCCGCDELNEVLRALRGTQSSLNTVENFTSRLAGEVQEMELTVLSSRLNDTGCGGGGGGGGGTAPTITITAAPSSVAAGASSTLTWSSTDAATVTIDGTLVALSGTMSVSPSSTHTYTATAIGAGGTASDSAAVTVTGSGTAPTITITAAPPSVASGGYSTLTWISTNATTVTIDGSSVALSGTMSVSPGSTHTYTAAAVGAGGTASASTTVTVTGSSGPPTINLTVSPANVLAGGAATLSWSSTNAAAVTIDGTSAALSGTRAITAPVTSGQRAMLKFNHTALATKPGAISGGDLVILYVAPVPVGSMKVNFSISGNAGSFSMSWRAAERQWRSYATSGVATSQALTAQLAGVSSGPAAGANLVISSPIHGPVAWYNSSSGATDISEGVCGSLSFGKNVSLSSRYGQPYSNVATGACL